ncbi:uncharacterized protein EV422DRAFT_516788 [Fimicolochytrium jonesii]|uniref:uncharacterized protein n=1 Tax=Fimicolochytrium jonesii TaxID=1396493 RepID=UPI0022FE4F8C|nr:uncharacterized protein EV422DRAFT_516788 [Fimicolochytrium jonesii]KAI8824922.1 hypothetical protein EV422DRAFT_516788 [Fimicolochytrium jonesii]
MSFFFALISFEVTFRCRPSNSNSNIELELRIPTSHSPHSAIKHTLLANKPHPPTLHTLPPELIRHILSFTLDHPTSGPNTTLRQMLATSNALFETYRRDRVVTDCVAVVLAERAVGIMSRNRTACTKSATKASTSKPPTTSETVAEDILLDLARELRVACVDAMIQRIGEGDGRARGVVKMLGNYRGMAVGLMGTSEGDW